MTLVSAIRSATLTLAFFAVVVASSIVTTAPASAAATVTVSAQPAVDSATTVTLSGSGFQYQPNAPGGVYVFFGAVSDGAWAPSQGGRSGSTFAYASTPGARLLVAFEGGSSAPEANGVINSAGAWSSQMTIPGSTFVSTSGNPHEGGVEEGQTIDCTIVQCGIITIGAHGIWNANNESFTPISFGTTPTQGFDDEAVQVEVPEQEEQTPGEQPEEPSAAPEATADPAAEATAEETVAPVAQQSAEAPGMSSVVIGVFAFGVIALLAAIIVLIVRLRAASKSKPEAGDSQGEQQSGEQHEASAGQ